MGLASVLFVSLLKYSNGPVGVELVPAPPNLNLSNLWMLLYLTDQVWPMIPWTIHLGPFAGKSLLGSLKPNERRPVRTSERKNQKLMTLKRKNTRSLNFEGGSVSRRWTKAYRKVTGYKH